MKNVSYSSGDCQENLREVVNAPDWDHGGRTIFLQSVFHNNIHIVQAVLDVVGSDLVDLNAKDNQVKRCPYEASNLCQYLLRLFP